MPSLTNDNNVNVQITTKADLEGINQTKSGMQGLGKQTEETAAKGVNWGGQIKGAGLIAGVALAGVVKVGGDLVSSFDDSAKYGAALTQVLQSTGGQAGVTQQAALDLSKQIEHSTALGDEAVLSGENMLLTFTNIGKDAFPGATQAVTDWATAMNGGAIPNADQMRNTAMQLGKALQDPDKGLGALHRVGVNTDELSKKFTASMSVQEKQKLILQELGHEFGGQAAAQMNTYAGKQAHLKEQIDDVKESMGQIIVKAMTPLQGAFGRLVPYLEKAADWLSKNKTATMAIAGVIGGLLIGVIVAAVLAIGWIPIAITAGAAVIGAVIAVIISKWKEWHKWILIIAAVIAATLLPFIGMAYLIIKHIGDIKEFFKKTWDTITSTTKRVADDIVGFFVGVKDGIVHAWWDIENAAQAAFNFIVNNIVQPVVNAIVAVFTPIIAVFTYIFDVIRGLALVAWWAIYNDAVRPVADAIVGAWNWVSQTATAVWNAISSAAQSVWNAIWTGVISPVINAIAGAISWAGGVVNSVWQGILDFARPIWNAVAGAAQGAWNWIVSVWQGAINWFHGIFNGIGNAASGIASGISNAFSNAMGTAKNIVISAINWMIDKINGVIHTVNNTAGKLPGVPKIGDIPRLYTGAKNFGGGWAVVGDNPMESGSGELVHLPGGSQIFSNKESKNMMKGGSGTTVNNYGDNHFYTAAAVSEYFNHMDQDASLINKGLSPTRGIS